MLRFQRTKFAAVGNTLLGALRANINLAEGRESSTLDHKPMFGFLIASVITLNAGP